MTKDLVQARLVCRHINLLIVDIVKRRLRSDLTSADGARCFIACNFRDPKWKEVGDLPRLSTVSMEQLEFIIEEPFIPRSLVSLVNTPADLDPMGGVHQSTLPKEAATSHDAPDLSATNVFTDEFDCEMAIVLFAKDGGLKSAETLYDGELRFRPRYDSPSRRGSLAKASDGASNPSNSEDNDINYSTSIYLTTSGRELISSGDDARAILNVVPRPEWEWRTDQSPSWIPCEARPIPGTDRQLGSIVLGDIKLEYHLVPKDIIQPSSPESSQVQPKITTVIGIEIKKLIVKSGQILRFLHDQLPEIQRTRVVLMPPPVLLPLPPFPTLETT
ncbi:hypothetical protein BGW42_001364 [Actinomortierella wolfii]|nr:hypothetical protein BGW42_001364 [Actinomortierella wolfii]